ncbi:MAG: hypothetical protein DMG65_24015 [Candidatus Angelobacter sp. Gp1-AA117]|nr:MAG: hypothetical protein DMG65_24015 [Candidatus Angelobacter sp. Gp1-AA117]
MLVEPELELYKSLLDESKLYREKLAVIWLQKLTILGGIIAFALTREATSFPNELHQSLTVGAILSLPVIAMLLDAKATEFGIHARVIDDFIIHNYREPSLLSDWERTKWGDQDTPARKLVLLRSLATVISIVSPTLIVAVLSFLLSRAILHKSNVCLDLCLVGFFLIYAMGSIIMLPRLLLRKIPSKDSPKQNTL